MLIGEARLSQVQTGQADLATKTLPDLVTVVIPCYNHAHYIGSAIESALGQSHKSVEILVVDDGSTDDTEQAASLYPSVHYIRQANQGLAGARNTGLHASRGDYLVFLDADDRLLPCALEVGVKTLADHPQCAFVTGHFRYIKGDGSILSQPAQKLAGDDPYLSLLHGNFITMHATVLFRRTSLQAVGGFTETLRACEDYDLYLRLTQKYSLIQHNQVVAEYRLHQSNMSGNPELMLQTSLAVLWAQQSFIDETPRYQTAFQAGIKNWQEHYGEKLLQQASLSWQQGQTAAARHALTIVYRYAPHLLVKAARQQTLELGNRILRTILPWSIYRRWREWRGLSALPAVGHIRMGDLRRLTPLCREFGYSRGKPIDRYYIEAFLARHAGDVRGRVLEIGDDSYTRHFGGERVKQRDVLHVSADNPAATFVGDLANADHIPSNAFDCIILTQTLHLVYDMRAAVQTLYRILKPSGVLLATVPGISQTSVDAWAQSWYWSFTMLSAQRLFAETFSAEQVQTETHGNVLAATGFLNGVAAEELRQAELDTQDAQFQMLITIRAVKRAANYTDALH